MRKIIRAFGWMSGATVLCFGVYVFLQDSLSILPVNDPFHDDHPGIIAGPILFLIGVTLMVWLHNSATISE